MSEVYEERMRHCLHGEAYRGYTSLYCGLGTLIFRSPDHRDLRVDSKADDWMEDAWITMKTRIDGELDKQDKVAT